MLFNNSLSEGIFPECFKRLKLFLFLNLVTQIWLRIIDLFPCYPSCKKMFEKLMCARLDSYLKSNDILWTNQFGFRKNSNASDAIIEFLDYVYSSLDKKQSTIAVYLYFIKAFDTVDHEILMSNLQHNGIRGVMLSWFKSYLSNRKQYVSVKNFSFSLSNITLGVPQAQCWAEYFFFCTSMTCIDPQTSWASFILLMIQQFLHLTVTLTVLMPQWTANWYKLITGSRPTDYLWALVKLHIW